MFSIIWTITFWLWCILVACLISAIYMSSLDGPKK